ncbi:hypothetical protein E2C01_021826 [Portunus trituberculatus]|uniref:Uncharacterized protein n=1 Tax=Portunus trituberculatus TaxID=210409 RepID=A0A5B7E4G2_PORTR|nr:hypothetical protein [Portunus trituberculatus]
MLHCYIPVMIHVSVSCAPPVMRGEAGGSWGRDEGSSDENRTSEGLQIRSSSAHPRHSLLVILSDKGRGRGRKEGAEGRKGREASMEQHNLTHDVCCANDVESLSGQCRRDV